MSFSYFHLLILFNRKLFSSSGYFSFVWLITFRIETFSFSDHWRFRMLINWAQSQLSPRNKTPNCFLLKLNRTLFGLFYQIFPLDKVANIMTETFGFAMNIVDIVSSLANIWTCEDNFPCICEFQSPNILDCLIFKTNFILKAYLILRPHNIALYIINMYIVL